jgi:hypothetical protein
MPGIDHRNVRKNQWFMRINRVFDNGSVFFIIHEEGFFQMHPFDVIDKGRKIIEDEFTFVTLQRIDLVLDLYPIDNIGDEHPSFGRWFQTCNEQSMEFTCGFTRMC